MFYSHNVTIHGTSSVSSETYTIDVLFPYNSTAYGSVCGGLLEAYRTDATLLNQFLNDETLAPSISHEIALNILSNHYQAHLKSNRLQLRLILHKRAKSIQFQDNERLFILSGNFIHLSNDQNNKYDAIQLKIFDTEAEILFNPLTVAYSWKDDNELVFSKDINLQISNDLFYPGYSGKITEYSE